MSEVTENLTRVQDAFERPTLRLLDRKWAPVILSVFRTAFGVERRSIPAEVLHAEVDVLFGQLREAGQEVPSGGDGRSACVSWVKDQWLYRTVGENGQEEYSLTSHALEALRVVDSLTAGRAMISESRLTTILDTARRWAMEANPDREDRVSRLEVEIAQLTAERDRLLAGGEIATVTEDAMLTGYQNMLDLLSLLPGDFRRVEEAVHAMHRQIIEEFRGESRPLGEVLDEYLQRVDRLMGGTPEGRAFEGAFELLRDNVMLAELRDHLRIILSHPSAEVLTASEQADFRGTVTTIRRGIDDVLARRARLSATLRDQIVNHDVVRDRELEMALRVARSELERWMRTARPRDRIDVRLVPPPLDTTHFPEQFFDPADHVPPPPLDEVPDDDTEVLSVEELRAQGGPQVDRLRTSLAASAGSGMSVAEVFNGWDVGLRRPVEILGLLQVLEDGGVLADSAGGEPVTAVRPDGSRRQFTVPRLVLVEEDAGALEEGPRR